MVLGKREHSIGFCVVLFSKGVQNPTSGVSKSEVRHGAASENKIHLCRESCWTTTFRNRVLVTSNHHGALRVFERGALLAIGSFFFWSCLYTLAPLGHHGMDSGKELTREGFFVAHPGTQLPISITVGTGCVC